MCVFMYVYMNNIDICIKYVNDLFKVKVLLGYIPN